MSAVEHNVCASCGTPIYWLKHQTTGRPAPIEVEQSVKGNIIVNLTAGTYTMLPKDEIALHDGWLHLNHFATCPQAKVWGKAGRS